MMATIDVTFEVWKRIVALTTGENDAFNDVITRLLDFRDFHDANSETKIAKQANVKPETILQPQISTDRVEFGPNDWVTKNVCFPEGTDFRGEHEGAYHFAKVQRGALYYDGQRFESASRAAIQVRKYSENGWRFWQCKRPTDKDWIPINALRRRDAPSR
jgi:predicted CopG family antitoxin